MIVKVFDCDNRIVVVFKGVSIFVEIHLEILLDEMIWCLRFAWSNGDTEEIGLL